MTLADYLEKHDISDADFAVRTGMARTEVWAYRRGRRMPRAPHLAAIEKATGGKVKARDFVEAA